MTIGTYSTSTITISLNTWYHLAHTIQYNDATATGTTYTTYLNGVVFAQGTGPFLQGGSYTATFGGANNVMTGYVDDCRVYNRTLSASEIQYLAQTTYPMPTYSPTTIVNLVGVTASVTGQYGFYTDSTGIYYSSNYGSTYTKYVNSDQYNAGAISNSGQYMYTGTNGGANPGRIYYSSNYGVTWNYTKPGTNISSICCSPDGSQVWALDHNGGLLYSSNFGASFTNIYTITNNSISNISYITNQNALLFGANGDGTLYRYYINAGIMIPTSASAIGPGSYTLITSSCMSQTGQYIYILYYNATAASTGNPNGVIGARSTNYGTTWSYINRVTGSTNLGNITCSGSGQYVRFGANGTTYNSSDYGASWTP
jgi:hypothetical protein